MIDEGLDDRDRSSGAPRSAAAMIDAVREWAQQRNDIRALALVGSHARGDAGPDSDVDLVLLCADPVRYLDDTEWVTVFGEVTRSAQEDWGRVRSVRVCYRGGPEAEFGVTGLDWAALPPDPGTREVLAGGHVILLDPDARLERVARASGLRVVCRRRRANGTTRWH